MTAVLNFPPESKLFVSERRLIAFHRGANNQPSALSPSLNFDSLRSRLGRISSPPRLPQNYKKRTEDSPCGDSHRPCQEFVSAWHAAGAIICFSFSILWLWLGKRWKEPSCARFGAIVWLLLAGFLVLTCHQYYCGDPNARKCDQNYSLPHNPEIVPQKQLDRI